MEQINQKFFKSRPFKCSYISSKKEQRLFSTLKENNQVIFEKLMQNGFRRNFNHMYIPICQECSSCKSSRVKVKTFAPSKSQKRNIKRNNLFKFVKSKLCEKENRFKLFKKYAKFKHNDGQMKDMKRVEFDEFFYGSPIKSSIYDLLDNKKIIGSILFDVMKDSLSAVYSFYDPDYIKYGLGNSLILNAISETKRLNLKYLYLGYWIKESQKMSYKSNYNSLELYDNGKWILKDN